ncbi:probable FRS1 - phenylalanyl-tRNA synthetase, beta subunit, cytosolic [Melanopsichium pennsylvanicum]|uniref:Phenylalanine--tRNA ligase beta subunit n=2 Tax=Melanopsichium pennsylvanicum TaxID=63383 RepID=A0AAJ4XNP2_9BASI|nr:probable FRS1 - phenylalanyl-tRNA synthetase, beta subunit, cytosolic [Melanopsichium pennsylvanicum]
MPTVSVDKEHFYKALGRSYTTQEFDELCFQFGIELDDDTTEQVTKAGLGERPQLKIDIPANRYDLLCHEGISRALNVFLGNIEQPQLKLTQPRSPCEMITVTLTPDVAKIRPFFAGAVLRGVTFTEQSYANFIDLQDKLHQNLARRRTLVAIGTHDLDTIQSPFTYEALPPKQIKFAPLNKETEYDASQLMELYESDKHLGRYLHIIKDSPVYPIIYDSNRQVLSMPPIINSNHSKITLETKNVFIDTTAIDETKLGIVINIIVAMFSEYCAEPFTVEPVKVVYPDGNTKITPDLSHTRFTASVDYINSCTGLKLSAQEMIGYLKKMGHTATVDTTKPDNKSLIVDVPPTRPDILHECDLMEDVAVAFGFDNLPKTFPATNTVAVPLPINKLADIVRRECAYSGWIEVLPLILCSHDENFGWLNRKDDGSTAVVLENPKTAEYQVVRTSLLPGLLKTIRENRKHALPLRTFEVSDIAFKDERGELERCARNERHVCAVYCDKTASFEVVHGLLDRLMLTLGVTRIEGKRSVQMKGYWIQEDQESQTFLSGRSANIHLRLSKQNFNPGSATDCNMTHSFQRLELEREQQSDKRRREGGLETDRDCFEIDQVEDDCQDWVVGSVGVVHPNVLKNFGIDFPCSAFEFNLEPFL